MSQNLWEMVENGYKMSQSNEDLATWSEDKKKEYKENKNRDAKAIFLIQQGVSKSIFSRIIITTKFMDA